MSTVFFSELPLSPATGFPSIFRQSRNPAANLILKTDGKVHLTQLHHTLR